MTASDAIRHDAERLKDALRILHEGAGALSSSGRDITNDGSIDPLTAISNEIEQTILRRALHFENDSKEQLQIIAGSRRALAVHSPKGDVLALSPEDQNALAQAQNIALTFCEAARVVHVQSHFVRTAEYESMIGVSPQALMFAPQASIDPPPSLSEHLQTLRNSTVAYVTTNNDEILDTWGSDELIGRIQLCLAQGLLHEHPCIIWADSATDGLCFGYLQHSEATLWVATTAEQVADLKVSWASYLGAAA